MTEYLVGRDYPRLCGSCRTAVDAAAPLLKALVPDTDDPEAPLVIAADLGLLCQGSHCDRYEEKEGEGETTERRETARFRVYASEIRGGFGATMPLWDTIFSSQEEALCAAKEAAEEKAEESPGRVVCTFGDEGGYFVIETIGDTYMFEVLPVVT